MAESFSYTGRVLRRDGIPVGTCFQVSPGIIVTAAHVVAAASRDPIPGSSTVSIDPVAGGDPVPAVLLVSDPKRDLAILGCDSPFASSVPGFIGPDAVPALTEIVISGVSFVPHDQNYRFLPAAGTWQGPAQPQDGVSLVRLEVRGVTHGMSGSPVRRISDDHVLGVVSGRYNSSDGWGRDTVWAARVDDLLEILLPLPGLEIAEVLPHGSQIYRVRPAVGVAAPTAPAPWATPTKPALTSESPREPARPGARRTTSQPALGLVLKRAIETSEKIVSVAMTRDGTRVAIKHYRNEDIFATESGRRLCTITTDYGLFNSSGPTEFSSDGKRLATAHARRKQVDVWDTSNGQKIISVPANASSMRFGPDGTSLAVSEDYGPIRIYALVPGTPVLRSISADTERTSKTKSFDYSQDGSRLAGTFSRSVEGMDGYRDQYTTRIWQIDGLGATDSVRLDDDADLRGLTLSPDGRYLAAPLGGRTAKIWDSTTGKLIESADRRYWKIAFNPYGAICFVRAGDGGFSVSEFTSGRQIGAIASRPDGRLAVSESAQVITVAGGKTCEIWHLTE
jgi:hypothetical protein